MPSHTGSSKHAKGAGGNTPTETHAEERSWQARRAKAFRRTWGPLEDKYNERLRRQKKRRKGPRVLVWKSTNKRGS